MQLGILSDTHGLLRDSVYDGLQKCDLILHAGDIGDKEILKSLSTICPTIAVKGNNDRHLDDLNLPATLTITLKGLSFLMVHDKKDLPHDLSQIDWVLYGHSHKFAYEYDRDSHTHYLNPGSCGKKRFSLPLTYALLTIEDNSKSLIKIDIPDHNSEIIPLGTL